jgi:hypothetical protein
MAHEGFGFRHKFRVWEPFNLQVNCLQTKKENFYEF